VYSSSPTGDSLTVTGATFSGNQAVESATGGVPPIAFGGAIFSPSRPLSITSSSFVNNQAIGASLPDSAGIPAGGAYGGAVDAQGHLSITIDRSTFQDNIAQGGASDFGGGNAAGGGLQVGGFFEPPPTTDVTNSTFDGNLAENGFGGVAFFPLAAAGGAIASFVGTVSLSNVSVIDNNALGGDGPPGSVANAATGGGIFNNYSSTMTLTNCSISGNLALGGQGGATTQIGGSAGNGADGEGGGIFNFGTLTMTGSTVSGNSAVGGAGGTNRGGVGGIGGNGVGGGILTSVYSNPYFSPPGSGTASIDNCIITGNQAIGGVGGVGTTVGTNGQGDGGGIAILDGATVSIQKTKVQGNFASTAGDDIYTGP
jgi:hypothetical protein